MTDAFAVYDEGRISQSLDLLKMRADSPEARALVALTTNHPEEVLREPMSGSPAALELRVIAAWRLGEGDALRETVDRLRACGVEDDECALLARVAEISKTGRLRELISETDAVERFDPSVSHVVVDVEVHGKPLRFCFDTGAEMSMIDARVAGSLSMSLVVDDAIEVSTNSGEIEMAAGLAERVAFLGVEWGAVPFLVADLSGLKRKIGVDGILGVQDLMDNRRIRIDYERGEISQFADGLPDGWPLYFTQGRALLSVEGRMDQGLSGLFRIDTGGARSMLTKEYLEASLSSGARWDVGMAQRETRLVFREAVRERRTVSELLFRPEGSSQGVPLSDVPVDTTAADDVIAYAGKLGADAFAGRVLELDYPACRMRLAPMGKVRELTSCPGES